MGTDLPSVWYHGSPARLTTLRAGSTVTPLRPLAEAFAHRPTLVVVEDDGRVRHDGDLPGYLYEVVGVRRPDVHPHPRSAMALGAEWLTRRDLGLQLVGAAPLAESSRLTADEAATARAAHASPTTAGWRCRQCATG